jgi:hypothetical protein
MLHLHPTDLEPISGAPHAVPRSMNALASAARNKAARPPDRAPESSGARGIR